MHEINFWISVMATIAFAVTGVLAIADRGVDIFGVLVLGIITAIGGGTVRDIILGVPSFWSESQMYVWLALGASILTFIDESFFKNQSINIQLSSRDGNKFKSGVLKDIKNKITCFKFKSSSLTIRLLLSLKST